MAEIASPNCASSARGRRSSGISTIVLKFMRMLEVVAWILAADACGAAFWTETQT